MKNATWIGGYTLSCGKPKEGAMYLMVDVTLNDFKPDLIYVHKGETFEATMFGYQVDDIDDDESLDIEEE